VVIRLSFFGFFGNRGFVSASGYIASFFSERKRRKEKGFFNRVFITTKDILFYVPFFGAKERNQRKAPKGD
jgi:hypothetical protein